MVRIIADEFLSEERDRKLYADQYTCCPPPLFILCITLIEVSELAARAWRPRDPPRAQLHRVACSAPRCSLRSTVLFASLDALLAVLATGKEGGLYYVAAWPNEVSAAMVT